MSLDGYIAGPDDDLSWLDSFNEVSLEETITEKDPYDWVNFIQDVGAVIVGKRTYEWEMKNVGKTALDIPTFVLTSSKQEGGPENVQFVSDLQAALEQAKAVTDKNIWVEGGGKVAESCIQEGVLDEMILFVAPVLLGKGITLFGDVETYTKCSLRKTREHSNGLLQLEYTFLR